MKKRKSSDKPAGKVEKKKKLSAASVTWQTVCRAKPKAAAASLQSGNSIDITSDSGKKPSKLLLRSSRRKSASKPKSVTPQKKSAPAEASSWSAASHSLSNSASASSTDHKNDPNYLSPLLLTQVNHSPRPPSPARKPSPALSPARKRSPSPSPARKQSPSPSPAKKPSPALSPARRQSHSKSNSSSDTSTFPFLKKVRDKQREKNGHIG